MLRQTFHAVMRKEKPVIVSNDSDHHEVRRPITSICLIGYLTGLISNVKHIYCFIIVLLVVFNCVTFCSPARFHTFSHVQVYILNLVVINKPFNLRVSCLAVSTNRNINKSLSNLPSVIAKDSKVSRKPTQSRLDIM